MTGIERLDVIAETMDGMPWLDKLSTELMSASIQIKREQSEDHDIDDWVSEHGGIEHVREIWDEMVNLCATIGCEPDIVTDALEALGDCTDIVNKRLMPPGMEWPKVDSKKVDFTTSYGPSLGVLEAVEIYNNGACNVMSHDGIVKSVSDIHIAKQDPIGADGLPIKKGDTVYLLPGEWCDEYPCLGYHGGEELEVFEDGEQEHVDGAVQCRDKKKGALTLGTCYPQPHQLTHTKPDIIGADGQPLKVGDTVWDIKGGEHELVITSIELDELEHVKAKQEEPTPANVSIHPSRLTHTKPEPTDSWERIYSDCDLTGEQYVEDRMGEQPDDMTPEMAKAHDLVRRAEALAERERAE